MPLPRSMSLSDSVLCLGKIGIDSVESWKKQIQWYSENDYFSELNRIDGMQTELEWNIFPGFTTIGILKEIQKFMKSIHYEPEHFNGGIIFVSMLEETIWREKRQYRRM